MGEGSGQAERGCGRLFDVYLVVDWSARASPSPARPSRDAVWVGERTAARGGARATESYWRTRAACLAHLRTRVLRHTALGRRVLLGYDVALGYPAGFAAALGLPGLSPPWRILWDHLAAHVVDGPDNGNNRFDLAARLNERCGGVGPGPFWGCPAGRAGEALAATSPRYPYETAAGVDLARWRETERRAGGVQPVWKLYGHGSVGGQTLMGIPAVAALRNDPRLAPISRVWPFEWDFEDRRGAAVSLVGPAVVHAELWPGLVPLPLDPGLAVRDRAQVRATARWLAVLDASAGLGRLLSEPAGLSPAGMAACVAEEGWILGVE